MDLEHSMRAAPVVWHPSTLPCGALAEAVACKARVLTLPACAAIRRLAGTTADPLERANLLPAQVEIMLSIGDVEAARVACRELEQVTEQFDTHALRATAAHAQGAVQLAEGDARVAIDPLRQVFYLWRRTQAPYEAARVRVLIGVACRALGDEEAGALEFDAARPVFERLRAAPQLRHLDCLCKGVTSGRRQDPLTPRELQVLRLIASGKTNKAIAAELFPSRAAATAYAYDRKLL